MATGSDFSVLLLGAIPHFNGGLFEDTTALPLRPEQIALLIHAADSDWSAVEPAIFGTLVERALDPRERHKLGAHYTPRSYVERLIRPALIEPLRDEWETVKAAASLATGKAAKAETAAAQISEDAKQHIQSLDKAKADASDKLRKETLKQATAHREEALAAVRDFHRKICTLRVLDPACGSGNFLYVSLELMKRLEAEVLEAYEDLGGDAAFEMTSFKISPRQFLGLELNRRAVAIAQLVLWIGFFQWQRKTTGKADTNERPLLPKTPSILQQDAVLAYDAAIPRRDPATGEIVTIWNGHTTKPHPVTGKEVPDDSARKAVFDYTNPRRAEWPEADVIVGNPPFIGASRMRDALGDGYTETLRKAWKGRVPESADFVMYWWQKAAELVQAGKVKNFGFITTNSIHQTFNRRVIEPFLEGDNRLSVG
jgi:type II restriction/modification system DNA methylase subunit YeeA